MEESLGQPLLHHLRQAVDGLQEPLLPAHRSVRGDGRGVEAPDQVVADGKLFLDLPAEFLYFQVVVLLHLGAVLLRVA